MHPSLQVAYLIYCFLGLLGALLICAHVLCSALACKAAVDNALSEMEAQREAHTQKERDLQIQQQASEQAAEQLPSIRYRLTSPPPPLPPLAGC